MVGLLKKDSTMPTKPYHVDSATLPRQSRFGGLMQETAVVMDHAING